jgi:predicted acyltransferase
VSNFGTVYVLTAVSAVVSQGAADSEIRFALARGATFFNSPAVSEPTRPERLVSLDALRGFDMAFIVGFGSALKALAVALALAPFGARLNLGEFAKQFDHVAWDGFHLEDLIFPLFVFIAGVSLTFSLPRAVERMGRGHTALRLLKRCFILFLLGIFVSKGLSDGIEKVRWLGVLQRIALASLGAGLLSLYCGTRTLIAVTVILLLGYWGLFLFAHSGDAATRYVEGQNVVNQFDAKWLAGRKYDGDHDPEGILSTFPAIASALAGVLAGRWIHSTTTPARKAAALAIAGLIALGLGWAWSWQFPVIKKLWTSSFVVVAAGWSALLLALFYWLVEIQGWRRWTLPWVWIGMNPITLYVMAALVNPEGIAVRLTGPKSACPTWLPATVGFALVLLVARFLYRRKIFLRV